MVTKNDIEIYLDDCGFPFEQVSDGVWKVESTDNNIDNIIMSYEDPILLLRVNLMKVPQAGRETFYERLLTLNATEIPHGAFGIENDVVVVIDTLQVENLDRNELQASLDSIGFTVAQYYSELKEYLNR
ncbi:molecular chaperone Tir [candidate division KSB3 bacterium]|uniref:Molecular chaperone Tir n=1 Tax=candidate division KSB3 bacterium TaxID=2044937 RepID=A0A2G6EB17_9BACT|nr:MAG: molecular chaperone Tir [candidate division KSB3 bacterium]PIE30797.1 MAG: molecular chaperone Tir [candidate division KSB3 bacterium]